MREAMLYNEAILYHEMSVFKRFTSVGALQEAKATGIDLDNLPFIRQ